MNKNQLLGLAAVAAIVILTAFLFTNRQATVEEPAPVPQPIVKMALVNLTELNESGEAGTATLKEVNGKVTVTLSLTGAAEGVTQPAHIHKGECPGVGAVVYPLTFPVDGQSVTTLDVSLDELSAQLPLAVNVHKSAAQSATYVSCGELSF